MHFCGCVNHSEYKKIKSIRQEQEKYRAAGHSDNRGTEHTPRKCFRCGYQDHLIEKCPKPPKENEKQQKEVHFNEKYNRAYDNGENNSDQKIYVSMTCMSVNDEFLIGDFGDV